MKHWMVITMMAGLLAVTAGNTNAAAAGKSDSKQIAHGEYLVKSIGQCGDCHTPMNEKGEFVHGKWLQGKKLDFAPRFRCRSGPTLRPTSRDCRDGTTRRLSNSS